MDDRTDVPHDDLATASPPSSLEDAARLATLSTDDLDRLPFGVVRLDWRGVVHAYNRYESERTRRRPDQVVGRNFFGEIAPCTNVQDFAGRFRSGVRHGSFFATFPYRFDLGMDPREVEVTLAHPAGSDAVWLVIRDLGAPAA